MHRYPGAWHVNFSVQTKRLCLQESSSLEEEEYAQLNQKFRQVLDENWTHVGQLKSTDERERVLDNSSHVRNTQETDILNLEKQTI